MLEQGLVWPAQAKVETLETFPSPTTKELPDIWKWGVITDRLLPFGKHAYRLRDSIALHYRGGGACVNLGLAAL